MRDLNFKKVGRSKTSPVDNRQRMIVKASSPDCWIDDYDVDLVVDPYESYTRSFSLAGIRNDYTRFAKYRIVVRLKSEPKVLIEVRFKVVAAEIKKSGTSAGNNEPALGADNAKMINTVQTRLSSGISSFWNSRFKLQISDPLCGERILDIQYTAVWVEKGEHYKIIVYPQLDRERVNDSGMHVSVETIEYAYAHEYAHCVGVPDEYSNQPVAELIKYIRPDGTEDTAIKILPLSEDQAAEDTTVMSEHGVTTTKKRHAWHIAIEAQALMSKALGRNIRCDIL